MANAALKKPFYDGSKVWSAAAGRWLEILAYIAGDQLGPALERPGKAVTCPIHGTSNGNGKGDGFRLYKNSSENGAAVCNTCGVFKSGIEVLQFLGYEKYDILCGTAEFLGIKPEPPSPYLNKGKTATKSQPPQSRVSKQLTQISKSSSYEESFAENRVDDVIDFGADGSKDSSKPVDASPKAAAKTESEPDLVSEDEASIAQQSKDQISLKAPPVVSKIKPKLSQERMDEIRATQAKLAQQTAEDSAKAAERISTIWRESLSLEWGMPQPILKYLKSRNVAVGSKSLGDDCLRYHPELPYYDEDENGDVQLLGKYPAIIAAIKSLEGEIITLHRTYLTPSGQKAPVDNPRKMLPVPDDRNVCAGAIHLGGFPADGVLGVAEGMETALSAMKIYRIPTWSLVSATILERFEIPQQVKILLIWADKDKSFAGQKAAKALQQRAQQQGVKAYILLPNRPVVGKSVDWNDVMVSEGVYGFPQWQQLRNLIAR
jgi:hypothetical protein